jgi:hypothetical protein
MITCMIGTMLFFVFVALEALEVLEHSFCYY